MIAIKTMTFADAIQLVEGCEKIDGGVVTYKTERNEMRCEIAIFQCVNGYVFVQMDVAFPFDKPLVIEYDQHLLMLPKDFAEVQCQYDIEVESLFKLNERMMTAVAAFIKGENV